MNILITGITGFVGSHMADYILSNTNAKIFGTKRWMEDTTNIKHLLDNSRVVLIDCDLLDGMSITRAVDISDPDIVFHFAAQSFPEVSFKTPVITLQTNIVGTVNLFEAIRMHKCNPNIVSVSSSEVYGMPKENEIPIKESNPIRPANPYSISKVGHDLMSRYYFDAFDMKIITTRMFSHEGARRGKEFALSSFAYQIAKAEKTNGPYIVYHGNLDSVRTYNHIDDAVEAYWICSQSDKFGEVYNIGGDDTCTVGGALNKLISFSNKPFRTKLDPERVRPTDITLQIPDSSKFRNDFKWKPKKNIEHICIDLLKYWRTQV